VSTIPNTSERREYHLNYEIWMLEETNKKHHDDDVIKNALIESFCVHARNLFELFAEEALLYTQNYRPFSHITKRKHKAILAKLNVHIARVKFQGRTTNDADKINASNREEMVNILSDEIKAFKSHLRPEYSDVEIRDLPRVTYFGFSPSRPPQAHTTTTTTSVAIGHPVTFALPPRKP
jgi:hypothetical protein